MRTGTLLLVVGLAWSGAAGGGGGVDWAELLGTALGAGGGAGGGLDLADLLSAGGGGGDWAKLLGAALSGAAHRHSDDPQLEDPAAHFQHSAATTLFTTWLQSLWSQMPEEWGKPVEEVARLFSGPGSRVEAETLFRSLENPQLRRQWIRALSGLAANWIKHLAQPQVQSRYLKQAAGYLGGGQVLHPSRPLEDSLTLLVDSALNRQFGLNVQSGPYLKPAVRYLSELVRLGGGTVSQMSAKEIDDRLAEALNSQVIETVLRVWRAHSYSMASPACDARLLCELNSPAHFASSNSTLKPAVTKIASLVSSWFLSGHTGTPFLELYAAATENYDCQAKFPANCGSFHEEDVRITTEYYHNEL